MAGIAALGFLHYLVLGPNKVTREDERNARRLEEGQS
jgi:formate dehydrogenase iron-sulfur subunit